MQRDDRGLNTEKASPPLRRCQAKEWNDDASAAV